MPTVGGFLRSRAAQTIGVVVIVMLLAAQHRANDGLWFQGDSPRHAANGLFWWDLLRSGSSDPMEFAVRYYARYPIINPAAYPPFFYLLEGLAFAAVGPSPHVAKGLVLMFGGIASLYTMAWARRWISPIAGWAGLFLGFVPGVVLWSNAVMLNIPAMALSVGALYHFRRWLETSQRADLGLSGALLALVLLTYYPAAVVLGIFAGWFVLQVRSFQWDRRLAWIALGLFAACLPIALSLWLAPVHTARHFPSIRFLSRSTTWTFYWRALPGLVGWWTLAFAAIGCLMAALTRQWQTEARYLIAWIVIPVVGLSMVPAYDSRYLLVAAPAFVIAGTLAVTLCLNAFRLRHLLTQAVVLVIALSLGFWSATRTPVPNVSGVRAVAEFLVQRAPTEAVIYDGRHDGLFGFYMRALDPRFERRMVRADKFLYERAPSTTFKQIETSNIASPADVVRLVRDKSGCQWIAFEVGPELDAAKSRGILREALTRSEFELVGSFPILGRRGRRIDLYRMMIPVTPISTVDLEFPAFNNRTFSVTPIARD